MNHGKYDTICFAIAVFICWFAMNCLYWAGKSITNNNKHSEYNYNVAAIKFQCIFAWLLFTVYFRQIWKYDLIGETRSWRHMLNKAHLSRGKLLNTFIASCAIYGTQSKIFQKLLIQKAVNVLRPAKGHTLYSKLMGK